MNQTTQLSYKLKSSDFISKNIRCSGELYLPKNGVNPPVVIMAHGMAAQKDFALPEYARWFVKNNMAVFLFDYRTFGKSDGTPRQIVDPFHHVQDWKAAIAHVRTIDSVDTSRIALWGSSFAGGHVITCAAEDNEIAAVITQIPFVSGFSILRTKSLSDIALSSVYGLYDLMRSVLSLSPHYSPVVADPGSFAAMNSPESFQGYMSIVPENSTWENKMASRGFLKITMYNPINKAKKVTAPTLVMAARDDSLIPLEAVKQLAGKLPMGKLIVMECNHFAPYTGELFQSVVKEQAVFLEKHLF